jgi:CCR4-NOT transcription complex subunit 3
MEKFKAVEKAMKTKAYSKEGLLSAAKLDPKERAKLEACEFLNNMVDELERQIETLEAEGEQIQATMKKGKNQNTKADRMAEIERITERHKWHQGKLELIKRSLENGVLETEQVTDLEEGIKYYVSDGMNEDFMEDDEMYDDLNLQEEEDAYGMNNENDRVSSQDTQSIQEEAPDADGRSSSIQAGKSKVSGPEPPVAAARRPSTQLKSPLPALATLHTPLSNISNGSATSSMKPASVPTRLPGETLKYASAAAAAASVGIAPLPPPPGVTPPSTTNVPAPLPPVSTIKTSAANSPVPTVAQPTAVTQATTYKSNAPPASCTPEPSSNTVQIKSPVLSQSSTAAPGNASNCSSSTPAVEKTESGRLVGSRVASGKVIGQSEVGESSKSLRPTTVLTGLMLTNCYSSIASIQRYFKRCQLSRG